MIARLSVLMVSMVLALPALAQSPPPLDAPPAKPEVIIGGQASTPRNFERCVEVEIGNARSYGCLNEALKRDVEKVNPTLNIPPIDARSSDTKLGIVNIPAVQQQYGQNFGRSVVPFRMPQPTFNGNPRR